MRLRGAVTISGVKSIGPTPQPVSTTQSYRRYSCGVSGPSRMRWPFSYRPCAPAQKPPLAGLWLPFASRARYTDAIHSNASFDDEFCLVVILHAKRMPHMPRRRGNARASAARPPFCTVARRFFFCARIPYGLVIRRVIVIGNRARRAHVRMAQGWDAAFARRGNRTWQTIVKYGKASAWTWKPMTSCASCARPRLRCHES